MQKSHSEPEDSLALPRSNSTNIDGDTSIDDILSGNSKEDPVLYGVSQMLSILKQHVTKPKAK